MLRGRTRGDPPAMSWWVLLFLLGVNSTLWSLVAVLRFAFERRSSRRRSAREGGEGGTGGGGLSPKDVAILIPAHNEEVCIRETLRSAMRLLPACNIHVIADGCTDSTAEIARTYEVNVLELTPARGKAGGIAAAVDYFEFDTRFEVLLITDADTELSEQYLDHGLALLDDAEMVALAGYAYSSWQPSNLPLVGRFLIAYRTRLYAVMQFFKYGQTWRHTNVAPIVPGFASMYRTKILPHMDLNPPGLVIEDFNMTFELHRKRLGKIAFSTKSFATAQDPDNLRDYYKQVTRWSLGFWQTLRRHGFWASGFSLALGAFLLEVIVASTVMIGVALGTVVAAIAPLLGDTSRAATWLSWPLATASSMATPLNLLLFVALPDYLLTVVVALWMRRPSLLVYGPAFLFIRLIDSTTTYWSLFKMMRTKSTGRWKSPVRRVVAPPVPALAPVGAPIASAAVVGGLLELSPKMAGGLGVVGAEVPARRESAPVLRDGILVIVVLCLLAGLVVAVAVPVAMVMAGAVVALSASPIFVGLAPGLRRVRNGLVAGGSSFAGYMVRTRCGIGRRSPRRPPSREPPDESSSMTALSHFSCYRRGRPTLLMVFATSATITLLVSGIIATTILA